MATSDVLRVDEATFEVAGVTFVADPNRGVSRADRFAIMKSPQLIEQYIALLTGRQFDRVVEIGVREGGSTALLALVGQVEKLVTLELSPVPAPALMEFIDQHNLGEVVRPYFGTDQSDRPRLAAIVELEFAGNPLDLVIHDGCHLLEPTTATFETLFPRLAPGGVYVIEDWSWQPRIAIGLRNAFIDVDDPERDKFLRVLDDPTDPATETFNRALLDAMNDPTPVEAALFAEAVEAALREHDADELISDTVVPPPREQPFMSLLIRLLLAVARSDEVISDIRVDGEWVTITRGRADLDPETFRLADVAPDFLGVIDG